jgi:hypothetical protein
MLASGRGLIHFTTVSGKGGRNYSGCGKGKFANGPSGNSGHLFLLYRNDIAVLITTNSLARLDIARTAGEAANVVDEVPNLIVGINFTETGHARMAYAVLDNPKQLGIAPALPARGA